MYGTQINNVTSTRFLQSRNQLLVTVSNQNLHKMESHDSYNLAIVISRWKVMTIEMEQNFL